MCLNCYKKTSNRYFISFNSLKGKDRVCFFNIPTNTIKPASEIKNKWLEYVAFLLANS